MIAAFRSMGFTILSALGPSEISKPMNFDAVVSYITSLSVVCLLLHRLQNNVDTRSCRRLLPDAEEVSFFVNFDLFLGSQWAPPSQVRGALPIAPQLPPFALCALCNFINSLLLVCIVALSFLVCLVFVNARYGLKLFANSTFSFL
jgi:hypothetical protein